MKVFATEDNRNSLFESPRFMYFYMVTMLLYILLSGYVLLFSGSVFVEGLAQGWWRVDALPQDNYDLWWSGLTAFPCLLGLIGGIAVIATGTRRFHKVKVLLFVPAAIWTCELVIINMFWGLKYWMQLLYLIPVAAGACFVLYCVINHVRIPILPAQRHAGNTGPAAAMDETGSNS